MSLCASPGRRRAGIYVLVCDAPAGSAVALARLRTLMTGQNPETVARDRPEHRVLKGIPALYDSGQLADVFDEEDGGFTVCPI